MLGKRIVQRTQQMFDRGVEEEVRRALAGPISATARQVIGLREVADLPRERSDRCDRSQRRGTPRTSVSGCAGFRLGPAIVSLVAPIAARLSEIAVSSRVRFSKWHGLGNDYLLIERAEAGAPLEARVVQRLCDYHFGIGSDGILEVTSVSTARAWTL